MWRCQWTLVTAMASLLLIGHAAAVDLDDVIDLLNTGRRLAAEVFETWELIGPADKEGGPQMPLLRTRESRTLARISELSRQIAQLEARTRGGSDAAISSLVRDLPARMRLELRLDALADLLTQVGVADRQLGRYLRNNEEKVVREWDLERHTLENFAEGVVSHQASSVRSLVERVHVMVAPQEVGVLARGVLALVRDATQESGSTLCSLQQSPQQLLYNIYSATALTELKGYAMMQFSWMLLRIYDKGNFSSEARIMRERYQERTKQKIAAVKSAMATAKSDFYRCDPQTHIEGETYVQVTRLLQGHIQNEVDMNSDSTCRENCGYYSYTKSYGCYHNLYCAKQQRCNGKLVDCTYYDSDMWVCQADKDAVRRYDWIEYENGRVLGQKASCRRGTSKVDSWWRWLFWHCSYCFCLCDEQGPKSDRYFNLRPVKANIANNMVITGLRFVKKNQIIHMQIQEGALMPRGGINVTSLRWQPVDNYRITDTKVVSGQDFHTLSWEQRAIDLDDLVAPPGHVLTGFRFRRVGTHLNPEIMSTPLNFSAGVLVKPQEKSVWHSNDKTDGSLDTPRSRLVLRDTDVPTRSTIPSLPDSQPEQFVLFTHTGMDADAAQTTVPFLDAQPVTPEPPTLLAGAGLFHKGRRGYGGFIAPKLITYDYSEHIQATFPPDNGKFRE